jgi:nucleoside-diphosphate-sugar epimerase
MRLAITGATGFVGSHLLDVSLRSGHEVNALTRREQPPREGLNWIAGRLCCGVGTGLGGARLATIASNSPGATAP